MAPFWTLGPVVTPGSSSGCLGPHPFHSAQGFGRVAPQTVWEWQAPEAKAEEKKLSTPKYLIQNCPKDSSMLHAVFRLIFLQFFPCVLSPTANPKSSTFRDRLRRADPGPLVFSTCRLMAADSLEHPTFLPESCTSTRVSWVVGPRLILAPGIYCVFRHLGWGWGGGGGHNKRVLCSVM